MLVNKTRAAELAGVSRRTFYNHIPKRKISMTVGSDGEEMVDVSELERVYGRELVLRNLKDKSEAGQGAVQTREPTQSIVQGGVQLNIQLLQQEISTLEEKNTALENVARREREQAQEEKEHLRASLKLAQEGQNRLTLQLEDKRGKESETGDWEKAMKAMETRLSNQEKSERERGEREDKILRQNKVLKNALKTERQKTVWQKLFG